ncbi:MAG: hypothetical protein H7Z37_03060 [Pyrinomonadaceae bacterium]|nr:hypothetical protein [Pyrinomonadaceae bacterium]
MKTWIQRVTPFFLTFALGLFIASFFVSLRPTTRYNRYERTNNYCKQRAEAMRNYESYNCPTKARRDGRQAREEWRNRRAFSELSEMNVTEEVPGTVSR